MTGGLSCLVGKFLPICPLLGAFAQTDSPNLCPFLQPEDSCHLSSITASQYAFLYPHLSLSFLPSNLLYLLFQGLLFAWRLAFSRPLPYSFEHVLISHCPQISTFPGGKPARLQIQYKPTNSRGLFEAGLCFEPFRRQQRE